MRITNIIFRLLKYLVKVEFKILCFIDKITNQEKRLKLYYFIGNQIEKNVVVDNMKYDCTYITSLKRVRAYRDGHEADTQQWIDKYILNDEILFDIGACIGEISIYAALKNNARVYSFEPNCQNYALLYNNIFINNLDKKIKAFNLALNDQTITSDLIIVKERYLPGKSHHHFSEVNKDIVNFNKTVLNQNCLGYQLDELIKQFSLPIPNHIKIDVDGNEYKIIKGSNNTLSNKSLKTIACEFNPNIEDHSKTVNIIKNHGFKEINHNDDKNTQDNIFDSNQSRKTINKFFIR